MFDRDLNERSRYFQAIADEYGHEEVFPARVYEIAGDVLKPHEMGLSRLRPKLYAASSGRDIVRVLELFATQGASYYVRWGVSLAYVPHKWNPKLRWHRTLKSARFDIWESPYEYFELENAHWREQERFLADRLHGETYLRKQMKEMWTVLAPAVQDWFTSTTTLPGVMRAIDRQTERTGASSHHSPSPSLVRAFTLARTGEMNVARRVLDEYFDATVADAVDRENLSAALESIAES